VIPRESSHDRTDPNDLDSPGIISLIEGVASRRYQSQTDRSIEESSVKIVTMLNQKGGVGKTSTTHHLAGTLAKMGKRVLLVDNDPQSSLSQGLFGPSKAMSLDPLETIAAVYRGDQPYPQLIILPTGIPNLDIVPGSECATSFNLPDPHLLDSETQGSLRSFLDECREGYDYCLIDCPPNLHLCSWAALVASDYILVPMQPEDYGAQGITSVRRSISMVQAGPNPTLKLLGYLLTMVAKKKIHEIYEETLRSQYGPLVLAARVPESVAYVEAIANRKPIAQYKPKGAPAQAIEALAVEILGRIAADSLGITLVPTDTDDTLNQPMAEVA